MLSRVGHAPGTVKGSRTATHIAKAVMSTGLNPSGLSMLGSKWGSPEAPMGCPTFPGANVTVIQAKYPQGCNRIPKNMQKSEERMYWEFPPTLLFSVKRLQGPISWTGLRPTALHCPSPLSRRVKSSMPEPHPGKATLCGSSSQLLAKPKADLGRRAPAAREPNAAWGFILFGLCSIIKSFGLGANVLRRDLTQKYV